MGLKIAVVGGGSTYTPELVDGIARRSTRLATDELVLYDIDPTRREIVGGLAERMLRRGGWTGKLVITGNRDEALWTAPTSCWSSCASAGSRHAWWTRRCRTEFGLIGQETTGPGGFAKGLRTVPVMLDLAEEVGRRSAPGAWIVDFTNPVGMVTQALLDDGHRAIGLCNVAIGLQRRFAAQFGVKPEQVALEHVGLNHLSWERAVTVDGVDRLPEMLENDADMLGEMVGVPGDLVRPLRACRPTTCATTTSRTWSCASRWKATRGHRRSWTSSAICSSSTGIRRWTPSRSCWSTAAARSTARLRRS